MLEIIFFTTGIILLIIGMCDFFFTALSGNGAGPVSKGVASYAHKGVNLLVKFSGRKVYSYSGLLVTLIVLTVWIILVWVGLFLVFSADPSAIVNSNERMANNWERLYFTGYTLSTLGLGNFQPTTPSFEILTSIFSFFGFIFFTSSMTYLISVSSALTNKRSIARSIQNLGKNPRQIANKFIQLDTSYSYQQMLTLQEYLDAHAVNHLAYPIVHYYSHPEADICLSINLVRLDEAVTILLHSDEAENLHSELGPLRESLTHFLDHLDENFSYSLKKLKSPPDFSSLLYKVSGADPEKLQKRREVLTRLLKSEGFEWKEIS